MDLKAPSLKLVAIVSLVTSFLFASTGEFYIDPGTGWHIGVGEYLYTNFRLPIKDLFLGVDIHESWIVEQYLADFINYSFLKFLGWHGAKAAILAILIYFYWFFLYPKVNKKFGDLISTIVIFIAYQAASIHFLFRPIYFSFICFGLIYYYLYELAERRFEIKLSDYLKFLIVFGLWSNLHPSFLLGLILILSQISLSLFLLIKNTSSEPWQIFKLLLAGLIGIGLNPYGYDVLFQVFTFGSSTYSVYLYQEWGSVSIHSSYGRLLMLVGLFVVFTLNVSKRNLIKPAEFLSLFIFLVLSFSHVRILPYLGIVAIFPLSNCFLAFVHYLAGCKTKVGRYLYGLPFRLERTSRKGFDLKPVYYLILIPLISLLLNFRGAPFDVKKDLPEFPWNALEYLKNEKISLVINEPNFGGWLDYFGSGQVKGIIDDRTNLLGESYYQLYDSYITPEAEWTAYPKIFNCKYLFLRREGRMAKYLLKNKPSGVVFKDDLAIVYKIDYET